jgi:DNA-binding transcriptional MerR regulator
MNGSAFPLWTIQELTAEVARALALNYTGARDARTRDVPDLRTIRYYTTLGLLNRPAEMRGRTALYSRRHLLQLVAIKQLQSRGLSLPQIQQRMLGATDATLVDLAGPGEAPGRGAEAPTAETVAAPAAHARRFWKARPAPVAARDVSPALPAAYEEVRSLQAVALTGDVTLLLPAPRAIVAAEFAAIRRAAAPLIQSLKQLQLIPPAPRGDDDDQTAAADQ